MAESKPVKRILVLKEKAYLSEQVRSVYEQYVLLQEAEQPKEKQRFHAFLDLPKFWEVRADGFRGAVYNDGVKKASIYYRNPIQNRIVERVEWFDENGKVYRTDSYKVYGYVHRSLFLDEEGNPVSKAFYSSKHEEIINVNYSNGVVLLFQNGMVKEVFASQEEFEQFALSVMSEREVAWMSGMIEKPVAQVLILTASELVYGIEKLSELLPEVTFHIAAHTKMSSKLTDLAQKGNVMLYPCVSEDELWRLFGSCSLYLDISHGKEIYDAVTTASLNDLLLLGFRTSLHNAAYVEEECIFEDGEEERLAAKMKDILGNVDELERLLKQQRRKAIMR